MKNFATFDARVDNARVSFRYSNDPTQRLKDLNKALIFIQECVETIKAMQVAEVEEDTNEQ